MKFLDNFFRFSTLLLIFVRIISFNSFRLVKNNKVFVIIKLSAMGDLLCLLPSIEAFKKENPDYRVVVITTKRSNPDFWQKAGIVDNLQIFNIRSPFISLYRAIRLTWSAEICIDADQYYQISQFVALFCGRNVGFRTPIKGKFFDYQVTYSGTLNEKILFYKLFQLSCSVTNLNLAPLNPILPALGQKRTDQNCLFPDKVICLYPGSSKNAAFRRWHIENYINLANLIIASDYRCVFIGGPDELELVPIIEKHKHEHYIGKWSLSDTSIFLRNHVELFVGNDAGALHIAESQGTKCIGIFGPGLGSKWGTLNRQSKIVEEKLACRPCIRNHLGDIPQECRFGTVQCLKILTVERVWNEIQTVI